MYSLAPFFPMFPFFISMLVLLVSMHPFPNLFTETDILFYCTFLIIRIRMILELHKSGQIVLSALFSPICLVLGIALPFSFG